VVGFLRLFAFKADFPKSFGHGTLFNLVNSYGKPFFCAPSYIKEASAQ